MFARMKAVRIIAFLIIGVLTASLQAAGEHKSSWYNTHDRVFLGGDYWANPMEDWRVVDGAAEVTTGGGYRNIQLITHELKNTKGSFQMWVRIKQVEAAKKDTGTGFGIGIQADIDDHRAAAFAPIGIGAGVVDGQLKLGKQMKKLAGGHPTEYLLKLTGKPDGDRYALTLSAENPKSGNQLGSISAKVQTKDVIGNIALVNNFNPAPRRGGKKNGSRHRFSDWNVSGGAFSVDLNRRFGPILWSMYSLHDSRSKEGFVMKMSALTGPLGKQDNQNVELKVKRGDTWRSLGTAKLNPDAWTATFRIPNWDEKASVPFRLTYRKKHRDGTMSESFWTGIIRANPDGRPLRIGGLTCQNHYGFPYKPVADNLLRLDPDMLFFSGDQLYESHGGYGLIREPAEPAILNYLRKYYMHGWAFRDAMRDRPTFCIPDDHDVFHGNIWGEGGAKFDNSTPDPSKGGYREPARMVNVVHKTNCGHHPDPYDKTPVKQDISVYYGDFVYGGVGFAVLGDRQWKSGPDRVTEGLKRSDHVKDPDFDTSRLDKPGLELLGKRQEDFLRYWSKDWRKHNMKVLLSQTVFAAVATHHGKYDGYLKADLDSGGWPQTARDRTVRILRDSMALHINGDQHLTTLVQYGADKPRDSIWSFCTPAIAAGYPRWWRPDEVKMPHQNRPAHGLPNTGEFKDGFGNHAYVYAVGNPEVGTKKNRYEKAHQKGSGFGLITVDTEKKTYTLDSFRFSIDATDGKPGNQFPGWPVTIHQRENRGENRLK